MIQGNFSWSRGSFSLDARFALQPAGVTGLLGPSGCGKTTLLRCIAGLVPGARGELTFGTETWHHSARGVFIPPHERGVGYVFQHAALFPHLAVRENIEYGIRRRPAGVPGPSLDDVVSMAGVGHLLDRSPGSLSGGERQRVAIARALAMAPRLLLLDEPVSSLDLDSRSVLLPYLQELCRHLGLPVVYVSHAPGEVSRLAQVVLRMDKGRIIDGG